MSQNFITMYVPIFREKLERLEATGRGDSAEAQRLRATLAGVPRTTTSTRPASAQQQAA